jgi:adenylosuccinate synthase
MPVTAIVGAQWGDEGKGKITDLLAQKSELVIRYGGGGNAGHTVVNEHGTFALHHIPCGIFNEGAISLIGTGAVVDFDFLGEEVRQITAAGLSVDGLRISSRAHVVMPYHLLLDRLNDEARGGAAIGTTRRGIGPCYEDKAARVGIQTIDLMYPDRLREKLSLLLPVKNDIIADRYQQAPLSFEDLMESATAWGRRFGRYIVDQVPLVAEVLGRRGSVLLEGQLGSMRDLDWGMYPYVTSSTTVAGGGAVGGGVPASQFDKVIGVVKAYSTSVGSGPMPTELHDSEADRLREKGDEYGATTGRPRRVGWFDGVAARYSQLLNGFDSIAITKLDVLDGEGTLRVCVAYEVDGTRYDTVPPTVLLERAVPVYEDMPGWTQPVTGATSWNELPEAARNYVERIESIVGARAELVSVGPGRNETIDRTHR